MPDIRRLIPATLLCACLLPGIPGSQAVAAVVASPEDRPIAAETVDAGDYYLGLDGQPVRFHRKKDVFLKLDSISEARKLKHHQKLAENAGDNIARTARALTAAPTGFSRIKNHRWNGLEILKRNPGLQNLTARTSTVLNSVATEYAPVFTSESGQGEYLILPDIIISFNSPADVQQYKHTMLEQFGMKIKNQMMFSETDFVLAFEMGVDDYSKVFSTTRELMALPYIKWAEPNMQVKLHRTDTPNPNDYLYREQWGLENWGDNDALCDADTDANHAWDLMTLQEPLPDFPRYKSSGTIENIPGAVPVIAIIDDGIKLDHPDLPIWNNPFPDSGIPGLLGNRCEHDINGCNFDAFYINGGRVYNNSDASTIVHPSPQTSLDTHGTQAAGIAAATRNNSIGIAGSAYKAEILPIRLGGFGNASTPIDCVALEDALSYAAKYADIISNSWQLDSGDLNQAGCQTSLSAKLSAISTGTAGYKRSPKGTPVLFSSGNSGAGWQKIFIPITSPNSTVQFTYHKDLFEDFGEDAVWIDNIQLPGDAIETIGATMPIGWKISLNGLNDTVGADTDIYSGCSSTPDLLALPVSATGNHVIGGSGHAIKLNTSSKACKYLEIGNVDAGTLSFWVWVSAETWANSAFLSGELFRTYVNSEKTGSDLITRGTQYRGINNEQAVYHETLGYPASHASVIAVGASNSGQSTYASVNPQSEDEDRAYFSQYGPTLDVVAPGISISSTTIDGGYNQLSGTSASAPLVAGIIANMLAINPTMSLANIKSYLNTGADQIGPEANKPYNSGNEFSYDSGFNKYYGHGRVNSYNSVQLAINPSVNPLLEAPELCTDPNPGADDDDWLLLTMPAILSAALKNK